MDLLNTTGFAAAYTQGVEPDGRESLVVVVKGTFNIGANGDEAVRANEQSPLVMADTHTGEPGLSAPVYESEFAPVKRRCDVLLLGTAYAPSGKPTKRMTVGLKVGGMQKAFDVVGDRVWEAGMSGIGPSFAVPFTSKLISYDYAFGGVDDFHPDQAKHSAFAPNPVGRGYHGVLSSELVEGTPLPNTEERGQHVTHPDGIYKPMSFGPVGRSWESRYKHAGTFDENWLANEFPFLPADFREEYYQSAPFDQQTDYLVGGEEVVLVNLTPDGRRHFRIPAIDVPVAFFPTRGKPEKTNAVADTLIIEPDLGRFTISWRARRPLSRDMFEMTQVLVGKMPRAWWLARELGKTYYPSLSSAIKARREEEAEAED